MVRYARLVNVVPGGCDDIIGGALGVSPFGKMPFVKPLPRSRPFRPRSLSLSGGRHDPTQAEESAPHDPRQAEECAPTVFRRATRDPTARCSRRQNMVVARVRLPLTVDDVLDIPVSFRAP